MKIPTSFTVFNHLIKIEFVDSLEDNSYGTFKHAECVIQIARNVNGIHLNETQICNTFWHEIKHVFQFFFNNDFDEIQAQCFANFMSEYELTKSYEPIPF